MEKTEAFALNARVVSRFSRNTDAGTDSTPFCVNPPSVPALRGAWHLVFNIFWKPFSCSAIFRVLCVCV